MTNRMKYNPERIKLIELIIILGCQKCGFISKTKMKMLVPASKVVKNGYRRRKHNS